MCTPVNSTGPPDAGNPHVRWEEGAPVGRVADTSDAGPTGPYSTLSTNGGPKWLGPTSSVSGTDPATAFAS